MESSLTIIEQLGGFNKLVAMAAASNFIHDSKERSLTFRFKGSKKVNCVKITLNAKDLYDMTFYKIGNSKITTLIEETDVYAKNLKRFFEDITGLYLSI